MTEPKHYPKPDYDRCNAGHKLVEVYDEKRNAIIWDCPICIRKMQETESPTHMKPTDAVILKYLPQK